MPLPTPNKGEEQDEFISRCMGNSVTNKEFPDNKQRAAVCHSQWRRHHKDAAQCTDPDCECEECQKRKARDACPDPIQNEETGRFEGSRPCAAGDLTEDEKTSISTFIGDNPYKNSVGINGKLRDGEPLSAEEQKIVADVDRAIAKATPLEEDTLVYRAVPMSVQLDGRPDPAFTSVSTDRAVAEEFADNFNEEGKVLEVTLKAGTRALDTSPFQIEGMQYQKELLLPRGMRTRMTPHGVMMDACPDPIQDPDTGRFEGSRPCAGGAGGNGGATSEEQAFNMRAIEGMAGIIRRENPNMTIAEIAKELSRVFPREYHPGLAEALQQWRIQHGQDACPDPIQDPDTGRFEGSRPCAAGEVNSESRGAARRLGLSTSYSGTDAPDRFKGLVVDNPLPHSEVSYADVTSESASDVISSIGNQQTVSPDSLYSPQDYIFPVRLEHYIDRSGGEFISTGDPSVAFVNGQNVIMDGNHRVAAAKLKGESQIRINHKGAWSVSGGSWTKLAVGDAAYASPADFTTVTSDGIFCGYASLFGIPDAEGDIIAPGAFANSLEERGLSGIKMLFSHDADEPIGHWLEMWEDQYGLWVRGQLTLEVERAREIKALMEAGACDGLSILGEIKDSAEEQGGRLIKEIDLWEVSVCTFPIQAEAGIDSNIATDTLRCYNANRNLPQAVRRVLPNEALSVYRRAFNQFAKDHPDASVARAHAAAWRVVRKGWHPPEREVGLWALKTPTLRGDTIMVMFNDKVVLDGPRKTNDGYLTASVKVARTGIQLYKGFEVGRPELDTVRVYRPEREVFSKDALRSFAHRPVTIDHPHEMVSAENWKDYAVGQTGDEVQRDGEFIRIPMVLMDAAAIHAVEGGKKQLSMGYTCDLKFDPGKTPSGESYDAVQTAIRGNHLAVVSAARGGPDLKIGDDEEEKQKKEDEMSDTKLQKVEVDGLEVEVTDATANILRKGLAALVAKAQSLEEKLQAEEEAAKKSKDAADAEIAALKQANEDQKLTPAKLDAAVKDRAELVAKAKAMIGDKFDATDKTDAEIRREVVAAKLGEKSKEWSDEQVTTGFDTLAAFADTSTKTGDKLAEAIKSGASNDSSNPREAAYLGHIKDMESAWRKPNATH